MDKPLLDPQAPAHPNALRRTLLSGASSAAAISAIGPSPSAFAQATPAPRPLPAYAAFKDPGSMIVHSANTIEMRRGAAGMGAVTAVSQLYVRNNLAPPSADIMASPDAWVLSLEGVRVPRQFTLAELKRMKSETVAMVLQCSGNGRGFFPSKPSGTAWTTGAAGCVMWTGVPVRELVAAQGGVAKGARFMTGTGGEMLPAGVDPKSRVERSVPLEAMQDAILAWQINGEPVPLAHGGPLRLVVLGFTGVNSVKYVKRLAFTAEESDSAIQQTDYRMTPASEKSIRPTDPSVWQMPAKSWVNLPLPDSQVKAGEPITIQGVAFGGVHAVRQVDVSTDGGATWTRAQLVGPDLGRFAWRQFTLNVTLPPGAHVVTSRVTDVKGNVQIENRVENKAGYINSSWRDHAVKVLAA